LAFAANGQTKMITHAIPGRVLEDYRQLSAAERLAVREEILDHEPELEGRK
jgi:hypothetical protein